MDAALEEVLQSAAFGLQVIVVWGVAVADLLGLRRQVLTATGLQVVTAVIVVGHFDKSCGRSISTGTSHDSSCLVRVVKVSEGHCGAVGSHARPGLE